MCRTDMVLRLPVVENDRIVCLNVCRGQLRVKAMLTTLILLGYPIGDGPNIPDLGGKTHYQQIRTVS